MISITVSGQTFELNNPGANKPNNTKSRKKRTPSTPANQPPANAAQENQASPNGIGWGSSIEVARDARAAQQALDKGEYRAAAAFATRAAHAAPQNTGIWFLLGYASRLAGQYSDSENAYKRGLQQQPNSIAGLSGLAQTYAKMGRGAEAQDILKKVIAANPRSVNDLLLAGELALSADPQKSLELLKRGDALSPSARSELLIARAYQRLNQPEESKRYLQHAESRDPNNSDVLRAVAAFYREAGQYDSAIASLKKAVNRAPDALSELGYTYQLAGRKKEAADAYQQAANRSVRDANLQLSAAQAVVNVGGFERAETFLKRAEGIDPNTYRLHAIRGQIAGLQDHNDDAINEYKFAIGHLPPSVPEGPLYPVSLHLSLYEMYQRTEQASAASGELEAARASLNKITGVEEASRPEFLRLRALVEADSNQFDAAEKDLKSATALDPNNLNIMLNYANLLWKMNRKQEASQMYSKALTIDPNSHSALTAMGYLARETENMASAEKYFTKLQSLYPDDFVSYLALGDLYTSGKKFPEAQQSYEKAHQLAPGNALVVAGGTNSALEGQQLPIAKKWVDIGDANPAIARSPQVMREKERYLTRTGQYEESAKLGYHVIEKLPRDPEAPVYLAYDLVFLNRYQEASEIVKKYEPILPKDKDLHLIAGYILTHNGQPREAEAEFTKALDLEPNSTGYVNRGYVRNDLREATKASRDFEAALKLRPDYGEAHLGLAYSYLQLRRAKPALREAELAAKLMGESASTHLARAEAYRQQIMFRQAEGEYRAALTFASKDVQTHFALADALYRLHRYPDSIEALKSALGLGPNDALVYAEMARSYAQMNRTADTIQAVTQAEKLSGDRKVWLATGEALLLLKDRKAAMQRYSKALNAPGPDRIEIRLALARLFAQAGDFEDSQQQVSFGLAEARVEEGNGVTAENLIEAAQIMMSIDQFELAKKFFERAQAEGADEETVSIGLANAYLATGETDSAKRMLASVGNDPANSENYEYLIAKANIYRQEQNNLPALTTFARANQLVIGNEFTERAEMALADQEGLPLTENISLQSEASLSPIFEDINIYTLDARLRGLTTGTLLPPPRVSYETRGDERYKLHFKGWPTVSGLVEERNARGTISIPSQFLIQKRNTYDTIFNGGINPVWHIGNNTITFNPGLQFTIRRDTLAPNAMNQNLFRQFLYLHTSPIGNWVTISGSATREAGPFTEQNLHSRDVAASINFVVGRPWGKTALITGYQARDVLFRPFIREYYTTDTYVGIQRRFRTNWTTSVYAEYLRSWRVEGSLFAIAQAMRPAFRLDYLPSGRWAFHASGAWSRGEGFHAYDNINNEFLVSYTRGIKRSVNDGTAEVPVTYPMRFSFGMQQQTFYDFSGSNRVKIFPVIRFSLF
ncbi:MAG: tetratricopeptide repeat protein [Acidobacteriaceae bacterium]